MLNEELIKELRGIFKEEYGFEIGPEEAQKAGAWLVAYFDTLAEIEAEIRANKTSEDKDKVTKRDETNGNT